MVGLTSLSPNSCELPLPDPVALYQKWRKSMEDNKARMVDKNWFTLLI